MQQFLSWQGLPGWMPWSRLAWRSSRHWPPSQFNLDVRTGYIRRWVLLVKDLSFTSESLLVLEKQASMDAFGEQVEVGSPDGKVQSFDRHLKILGLLSHDSLTRPSRARLTSSQPLAVCRWPWLKAHISWFYHLLGRTKYCCFIIASLAPRTSIQVFIRGR